MAATHTTAVAAWHAYTIDYNTYRLGEDANIDTDAHSRDRGACTTATMRSAHAPPRRFSRTARGQHGPKLLSKAEQHAGA